MPNRRPLPLRTPAEVIAEIERLRDGGYTATGRWNLAQICDHLTKVMALGFAPPPFRMPGPVRRFVTGPLIRGALAKWKMPAGAPAPKFSLPTPPPGADEPGAIDACLAMLRKVDAHPGPFPPHPVVDDLTPDDWKRLQCLHACHHLGFLAPKAGSATA